MTTDPRILYNRIRKKVEAPDPREETLLMSYNVRYYNDDRDLGDRHWFVRAKYVLRNIGRLRPDLLSLQEVKPPQYDFFEKHLSGYRSVMTYRDKGEMSEACPIYYSTKRYEQLDSGTFWLSETPDVISKSWGSGHCRISTYVKLRDKVDGRVFTLFNAHPDNRSEEARVRQLGVLADRVARTEGMVIVTGDFNAPNGDVGVLPFQQMLRDSKDFTGVVYGATSLEFGEIAEDDISMAIDHIFLPKDTKMIETGSLRDRYDGIYPSDHYPIYSRVIF